MSSYNYLNEKTKNFPLPIPSIDKLKNISEKQIKKAYKKYNIPEYNKIIFLGTNASANEQHLKIIDSLEQLEQKGSINTSEIILIFPLTYSESRNYDQDKSRIIT
jgi:hypothetical protein